MYRFIVSLILIVSLSLNAQTISIALKNAPTEEVITYLAEETGKNIVLFDTIKETKSLRIENSSFDEIINSISKLNQLSVKKEGNIYHLSENRPNEKVPTQPHSVSVKTSDISPVMPAQPKLITKNFKLHYAKAAEVIETLTKGQGNMLAENGYIHFDERSNSLIIKDSTNSLKSLAKLIKELDKPTEQIAIEARIVTISSEHLQELGVRWGMFAPSEGYHKVGGNLEGKGFSANNLNVNFPVAGSASVALQVASINSRVLDLELTALERENSVEIIASPRLLTTNKKSASIKQGTEIPYALYSRNDSLSSIEFREAVLGLDVTPHISANNQILLDLVISQNSPNNHSTGNGLTTIDKQEINTQVFAQDGQTIVLGGIFQHLITKAEDKVPLLGSIPVIKRLFSYSRDKISKRELVIFVTPRIIKTEKK
ncbi:secretin [Pasteurellaceae bacterium 15-036681]|nr:secretin [Pasteurellaceae bacterium 15-036681]